MTEKDNSAAVEEKRLLKVGEAQRRYSMGRKTVTDWAYSCNAIVRFGKVLLFDRVKMDEYLDNRKASL